MFGVYQEGDVVWVQDYHLMLLPALLKKQKPKMKVRSRNRLARFMPQHRCRSHAGWHRGSGCRHDAAAMLGFVAQQQLLLLLCCSSSARGLVGPSAA